ncbi:hypothetical protein HNP40_002102 [Mycobacteroides chelonae]|nr:hypothetical protein [Mycobacteroides chelonae]
MNPDSKVVVGLPTGSTELFDRVGDVVTIGLVEILAQRGAVQKEAREDLYRAFWESLDGNTQAEDTAPGQKATES